MSELDEMEQAAREMEARLAELAAKKAAIVRANKPAKVTQVQVTHATHKPIARREQLKDGEILRRIQQDQSVKAGFAGPTGPTLINKIEAQMDKRRKIMEDIVVKWPADSQAENAEAFRSPEYILNKGRYEGFAAALAVLRSSGVREEINRSNERLGIE